ncbi:hypothetical protein [Mucilaginibacter sp.]|uniref:hypothetical protein n=1 Tax=Mucilaginibacter sp. TaxID=1882438 RepID=UPI002620E468|nr:hypothetical protein [Mucilaginibacter sp.]
MFYFVQDGTPPAGAQLRDKSWRVHQQYGYRSIEKIQERFAYRRYATSYVPTARNFTMYKIATDL